MNTKKLLMPLTLSAIFWGALVTPSSAQTVNISANLSSDPVTFQGRSGGTNASRNCGFIPDTPNQVIRVTERVNYMRLQVEAAGGEPTLLVDGPDGRFCVLSDNLSGRPPEISGVWLPGQYTIYVGDRTGGQYPYRLSISQQSQR